MKRSLLLFAALTGTMLVIVAVVGRRTAADQSTQAQDAAIESARREVRLLDDVYKTAVVLMNDTYVQDESSTAAAEVARQIFGAMKEKGWHDARLIDATGKPLNEDNRPKGAFEERAVKALLAGETYLDEVVESGGKSYLQAVTLVPAVNQKCILCHPGHKVGDVLGGISYKLPIGGTAAAQQQ